MSESAGTQLDRIVVLVAELSRREAGGEPDATVDELAARFGTTAAQIRRDVVTLTSLGDDAEAEWLSSLGVTLEGDRLGITSQGPFRRPVRFSPLELAAMQVGLAAEAAPAASGRLTALLSGAEGADAALSILPQQSEGESKVVRLALRALDENRVMAIKYAGGSDRVGSARAIELRDVAYALGRYYLVAWCRNAGGWRVFRADRVLDATLDATLFVPREEALPPALAAGGVFHVAEEPDAVVVRFSPRIARWIRERYPDAVPGDDGSATLTFQVADPQWLLRTVLQYGAEAVVVGPSEYRDILALALRAG